MFISDVLVSVVLCSHLPPHVAAVLPQTLQAREAQTPETPARDYTNQVSAPHHCVPHFSQGNMYMYKFARWSSDVYVQLYAHFHSSERIFHPKTLVIVQRNKQVHGPTPSHYI